MTFRRWMAAVLLAAAPGLPETAGEPDAGQRTYRLHCAQCHGADGDALSYADIVPIAGIHRRYPADVIGKMTGAFSGRVFHGRELDQLVHYVGTLRGSKGFPDPGWLITPHLLEKKAPRIGEFRVLDARGMAAYAKGHVPNAVPVEPAACVEQAGDTARWLGSLAVTRETMVVVYDTEGGPAAACVWWRIRRAGHEWVAVLDGGWNRWKAEQRAMTTVVPKTRHTDYKLPQMQIRIPARTPAVEANDFDWRATLDSNGFRRYEELLALAEQSGIRPGAAFRTNAPQHEVAHMALVLHLLGYGVD